MTQFKVIQPASILVSTRNVSPVSTSNPTSRYLRLWMELNTIKEERNPPEDLRLYEQGFMGYVVLGLACLLVVRTQR